MTYPGGWRPHLEDALCLDVRQMARRTPLTPGTTTQGRWYWTTNGHEVASVSFTATLTDTAGMLVLDYSHADRATGERQPVTCRITLETIANPYGGRRWFARCPATGRRAVKLYKWPGIALFCHREAVRPKPTYAIQRLSGTDRINAQRWALRRKLGDTTSDLMGEPDKPKWTRWRTFERYADRDAELADRDAVCLARVLRRLGVHID